MTTTHPRRRAPPLRGGGRGAAAAESASLLAGATGGRAARPGRHLLQPAARARRLGRRTRVAGRPVALLGARRRGRLPAPAAGRWRGALAFAFGVLGSHGARTSSHIRDAGAPGDDFTGRRCRVAGAVLLGLGRRSRCRRTAATGAAAAAGARWRAARSPLPARRSLAGFASSSRSASDRRRRTRRAVVAGVRARRPRTRTSRSRPRDGRELDGWYVPSRNGAAVIAFPRRQRHRRARSARAHARPPRLRRAAARPPRRGRERGRPERLGGAANRTRGRDRLPRSAGPTSTPAASAGSASRSAASAARGGRDDRASRAVVSDGAAAGRSPTGTACRARPR